MDLDSTPNLKSFYYVKFQDMMERMKLNNPHKSVQYRGTRKFQEHVLAPQWRLVGHRRIEACLRHLWKGDAETQKAGVKTSLDQNGDSLCLFPWGVCPWTVFVSKQGEEWQVNMGYYQCSFNEAILGLILNFISLLLTTQSYDRHECSTRLRECCKNMTLVCV